jgi:hypothetical protein
MNILFTSELYLPLNYRIMKAPIILLAISGIVQCRNEQQPIKADDHISQPLIGFGTWNLKESADNTSSAVALALEAGYRQIDCAAAYGNEKEVGKGIAKGLKKAGLKREDIWVTSKLWNDEFVHALTLPTAKKLMRTQPCTRSCRARTRADPLGSRSGLLGSIPHALARRKRS